MSFDRKGFDKLCQEVIRGNVEMIVIENKDRLMRFGYEMFEKFFRYFGTKILVLNDEISNKSYEQELTDDLISIIHSSTRFSLDSGERKKSTCENNLTIIFSSGFLFVIVPSDNVIHCICGKLNILVVMKIYLLY